MVVIQGRPGIVTAREAVHRQPGQAMCLGLDLLGELVGAGQVGDRLPLVQRPVADQQRNHGLTLAGRQLNGDVRGAGVLAAVDLEHVRLRRAQPAVHLRAEAGQPVGEVRHNHSVVSFRRYGAVKGP